MAQCLGSRVEGRGVSLSISCSSAVVVAAPLWTWITSSWDGVVFGVWREALASSPFCGPGAAMSEGPARELRAPFSCLCFCSSSERRFPGSCCQALGINDAWMFLVTYGDFSAQCGFEASVGPMLQSQLGRRLVDHPWFLEIEDQKSLDKGCEETAWWPLLWR